MLALNVETRCPYVATQQRIKRVSRGKNSGQSFEPLLQLRIKVLALQSGITIQSWVDAKNQNVARIKTGVNPFQISQSPRQQTRSREQQNRQSYLRDHQNIAEIQPPLSRWTVRGSCRS